MNTTFCFFLKTHSLLFLSKSGPSRINSMDYITCILSLFAFYLSKELLKIKGQNKVIGTHFPDPFYASTVRVQWLALFYSQLWLFLGFGNTVPPLTSSGLGMVIVSCSCQSQYISSSLIVSLNSANTFINTSFIKLSSHKPLITQSIFCQIYFCYIEQMSFVSKTTRKL